MLHCTCWVTMNNHVAPQSDAVMSKGAHDTCTYLWCLRGRRQGTLLIWTSSLGANCSDLLRRRLHTSWHQWIGCWRNENCAGAVTQLLGLPKWSLRCLFKAGSKMFYAVSSTQDNQVFQTQVQAHLAREIQWLQQLLLQPLLRSFDNGSLHLAMSAFWLGLHLWRILWESAGCKIHHVMCSSFNPLQHIILQHHSWAQ
jgi:hypothetical protein